jgi:hypothetical protein
MKTINKCKLLFGEGKSAIFTEGRSKCVDHGDGFITVTGKVKIADGTKYDAIIDICAEDSGENYGVMLWVNGELTHQQDSNFLTTLNKTADQVFPYRYNYRPHYINHDHHVGDDGWSL